MSKYETLTIIINAILALTSVISCIKSFKVKNDIIEEKKEITNILHGTKFEGSINDSIINSGENKGIISKEITGGVQIGDRK